MGYVGLLFICISRVSIMPDLLHVFYLNATQYTCLLCPREYVPLCSKFVGGARSTQAGTETSLPRFCPEPEIFFEDFPRVGLLYSRSGMVFCCPRGKRRKMYEAIVQRDQLKMWLSTPQPPVYPSRARLTSKEITSTYLRPSKRRSSLCRSLTGGNR